MIFLRTKTARRWAWWAASAAVLLIGAAALDVWACGNCSGSGNPRECSHCTTCFYGTGGPPSGVKLVPAGDCEYEDTVRTDGPYSMDASGNPCPPEHAAKWKLCIICGCNTSDRTGDPKKDWVREFWRDDPSPIGKYYCPELPSGVSAYYDGGVSFTCVDGTTWSPGSTVVKNPAGVITMKQTFDAYNRLQTITRGYEYVSIARDNAGRPTLYTCYLAGTLTKKVYIRYTMSGALVARKRVTVEEYNTDHNQPSASQRFLTTVCGYFTNGVAVGKLRYVVEPEGVKRYLANEGGADRYAQGINPNSPGDACGLDSVATDQNLMDFAASVCDYTQYPDGEVRITQVRRSEGAGCCPGNGETGTYTLDYGHKTAVPDDKFNTWYSWRRITAPSGLRIVEFYNAYETLVFSVVQEMNADNTQILRRWVDHYIYYTDADGAYRRGLLKEHRHPSACLNYTFPAGLWTSDVTPVDRATGFVQVFDYHDPSGKLSAEKVRSGTSGTEYWVAYNTYTAHTAENRTVYQIASSVVYPTATTEVDAADRLITSYSYAYYTDNQQPPQELQAIKTVTVTHPTVPTDKNGSDTATVTRRHYAFTAPYMDPYGWMYPGIHYLDWTEREDGSYAYAEQGTQGYTYGLVTKTIEDVDTDAPGAPALPEGWAARTTGANLTTTSTYDAYGRLKTVTAPGGQKTVRAHMCLRKKVTDAQGDHETSLALVTLSTPHMDGNNYSYAPVQVAVSDLAGRTRMAETGDATSDTDGNLANDWDAAGTEENAFQGSVKSKAVNTYNNGGQLTSRDQYYDVAGAKKLSTTFAYNATTGLQEKVTAPDGTITFTKLDQPGRPIETWMGTNATGATQSDPGNGGAGGNNLKKVSATFYDEWDNGTNKNPSPGSGVQGVGDSNVTQTRAVFGDGANDFYQTVHQFDDRNRLVQTRDPDNVATLRTLDNLGRPTKIEVYRDADADLTKDAGEPYASISTVDYDQRGQVYRARNYRIVAGAPTNADLTQADRMTVLTWYDKRGRPMKTKDANSLFRKTSYDGAGRATATCLCYDAGTEADTDYTEAGSVSDDTVIEQAVSDFDAGGNVLLATHYQRTDSTNKTGDLSQNWAAADSRRTYVANWFDALGRLTSTVDYGTNDGQTLTRPDTAPNPNMSDDYIVTKYVFDAATGRLQSIYDNKNIQTRRVYDDLGRTFKTIENYQDGTVGNTDYACDRTTAYEFDAFGRPATLKAYNPKGDSVEVQQTRYVYGSALNKAWPTAVIYPDAPEGEATWTDGAWVLADQTTDHVSYTYDRLGRQTATTDQRGVVNEYAYVAPGNAGAGRREKDCVTNANWPSGVDDHVKSLKFEFDDFSRTARITSYADNACAGTVRNQIVWAYDGDDSGDTGWRGIKQSWQSHAGAAITTGNEAYQSPHVHYAFEDGLASHEAKYVRLDSVTYPGASRTVYYNYPSGVGGALARLDNIAADGGGNTQYAQYTYLGAGTIVKVAHPQVTGGFALTYGTGGTYGGSDRFGRVVDQKWTNTAGTVLDQFKYGYDRASNRIWRDVGPDMGTPPAGKDEFYIYDGLHRLIKMNRGNLAGTPPTITDANAGASQAWGAWDTDHWASRLDALGNWPVFKQDDNGGGSGDAGWELNQMRTHNAVNETTGYTVGNWVVPAHDAAGNMMRAPRPGQESTASEGLLMVYDAWNRQAAVYRDANGDGALDANDPLIQEARYDGLNRRILKIVRKVDGENVTYDRTDYYYNERWQCLEERTGNHASLGEYPPNESGARGTVATTVKVQWLWDIRYVDAPVLRWRSVSGTLDETLYYCNDANMNVTALVNTSGTVVERYLYDPYGKPSFFAGDWTPRQNNISAYSNEILYCGYRFDPESGLYHVRHRYYHPALGRWMTRDPVGYFGAMNLVSYAASRPTTTRDPLGLWETWSDSSYWATFRRSPKTDYVDTNRMTYTVTFEWQCNDKHEAEARGFSVDGTLEGELDSLGLSLGFFGVTGSDFVTHSEAVRAVKCPSGQVGTKLAIDIRVYWKFRFSIGFNPGVGPFSFDLGLSWGKETVQAYSLYQCIVDCCCPAQDGDGSANSTAQGTVTCKRIFSYIDSPPKGCEHDAGWPTIQPNNRPDWPFITAPCY